MATASTSHTEGQLLPTGWDTGFLPLGGAAQVCALIPTDKGVCSQTREAVRGPERVCRGPCARKPVVPGAHMSGRVWGGHSRAQACAYLCTALQEAPPSAPGPTRGASLACPCPTHLASLAATTVTQGRSGPTKLV